MSGNSLLMALHSSTERFGVAVHDPMSSSEPSAVQVFDDGRGLSNTLITRVSAMLPRERWTQLSGLAVATGPGGFTGTRLSVVMARTLAEQLRCPLLGISSFALMAPRLHNQLPVDQRGQPFWIARELPRRGLVAGCYSLDANDVNELEEPHLVAKGRSLGPIVEAAEDVHADVLRLLELLRCAHLAGKAMPWSEVLPIYPTSPVGQV
jgi:tRNA threonylcarbamoyl adenosine modification protein YeaZ